MKVKLLRTVCVLIGFLCLFARGDEPFEFDFVLAEVADVTE